MNKAVKKWERYSVSSLLNGKQDDSGRLFLSQLGQVDLAGVNVLHHGLDTVKQLYSGFLRHDVLEKIETLYNEGYGECLELADQVWLIGSGGASGYAYRLQNSDLGLILFFKSRFVDNLDKGSHVKIECSPHWLVERSADEMRAELDRWVALLLTGIEPCGVAVHMCVDVQGWQPSDDFTDRLCTRARRIVSHEAGKVLYMDMGEVAMKFNRGQSFLVGSASSVQMAVYRKDIQAKAVDKLDFWETHWRNARGDDFDIPLYDKEKPVWRIELRFHHSVLQEFGRGAAEQMEYGATFQSTLWANIRGVSDHLTGLWRYGLESFRLEVTKGTLRYLDPIWQFLMDDLRFGLPGGDYMYRRVKKAPGIGNEKNLMLAFGNLLSVYARNRFSPKYALECVKKSGIYDDLVSYLENKAFRSCRSRNDADLFELITKGLQLRTLLGKAA